MHGAFDLLGSRRADRVAVKKNKNKNCLFLKIMEMQGEGKSSEKRISKGRGAKTGQSAVCLMRDGLRAGPKPKCCLSVAEVL